MIKGSERYFYNLRWKHLLSDIRLLSEIFDTFIVLVWVPKMKLNPLSSQLMSRSEYILLLCFDTRKWQNTSELLLRSHMAIYKEGGMVVKFNSRALKLFLIPTPNSPPLSFLIKNSAFHD